MKDILMNIDCLEGMKDIPDKSIDMICTDLPYGQTKRNKWDVPISFEALWGGYNRIIKDNGAIILFGAGMFTADLMESNRKMWRYNLIWQKTNAVGFLNAKRMPLRSHEDICVFYKKLPTYNPQMTDGKAVTVRPGKGSGTSNYDVFKRIGYSSSKRYPTSVWKFKKDMSGLHPTQKPIALIEELIKTYSNPGDLIFDSCAGSMTVAAAAINTGRHYICFEKDPEIFEKGSERIEKIIKSK